MRVWEIPQLAQEIIDRGFAVDEETGEVLDAAEELAKLELTAREVLEYLALDIMNKENHHSALGATINNLSERRAQAARQITARRKYVADLMEHLGYSKVETDKTTLSFRKSTATEIDDQVFMPWAVIGGDYLKYSDPVPDRKLIADALKAGADIPGARLAERRNLQVK